MKKYRLHLLFTAILILGFLGIVCLSQPVLAVVDPPGEITSVEFISPLLNSNVQNPLFFSVRTNDDSLIKNVNYSVYTDLDPDKGHRVFVSGPVFPHPLATYTASEGQKISPGQYWALAKVSYGSAGKFKSTAMTPFNIIAASPSASPSILPTISPSASSSASPSVTIYTTHYRIAENAPNALNSAPWVDYTSDPVVIGHIFSDTLGAKSIWVEFKDSTGKTDRKSLVFNLKSPDVPPSGPPSSQFEAKVTSPAANTTVTSTFSLTASTNDNSKVEFVRYDFWNADPPGGIVSQTSAVSLPPFTTTASLKVGNYDVIPVVKTKDGKLISFDQNKIRIKVIAPQPPVNPGGGGGGGGFVAPKPVQKPVSPTIRMVRYSKDPVSLKSASLKRYFKGMDASFDFEDSTPGTKSLFVQFVDVKDGLESIVYVKGEAYSVFNIELVSPPQPNQPTTPVVQPPAPQTPSTETSLISCASRQIACTCSGTDPNAPDYSGACKINPGGCDGGWCSGGICETCLATTTTSSPTTQTPVSGSSSCTPKETTCTCSSSDPNAPDYSGACKINPGGCNGGWCNGGKCETCQP